MKYPVLCFDRDQTIDVNPPQNSKPVPLSWVQFFAHHTDHHVWATGNQQLQIEAAIPTPYEARQLLIDNGHSVKYLPGGGDRHRTDRLNIINKLYDTISEEPEFIVIDDANLTRFCDSKNGWNWYRSEKFVEKISEIDIPEPDVTKVSGSPYNNTEEHGTYNEMLSELESAIKERDNKF